MGILTEEEIRALRESSIEEETIDAVTYLALGITLAGLIALFVYRYTTFGGC